MLVKCICTNCAGHLEFEEENAGERIACPHCGFKTRLSMPGDDREHEDEVLAFVRRRILVKRLKLAGASSLILAAAGYCIHRWLIPWMLDTWPSISSETAAWVWLIAGLLALPFALGWLVLPLFVMWQIRHLHRLIATMSEAKEPVPLVGINEDEMIGPLTPDEDTSADGERTEGGAV